MKKYKHYLIAVLIVIFASSNSAAEPQDQFTKIQIDNLINGIHSDNNGLMRSSIYFAGKYKIAKAADALFEVLETESDPSNIILIALAIYQIGDRDAMMKVIDKANSSNDSKVQHMLSAIALQYLVQNGISYVLK